MTCLKELIENLRKINFYNEYDGCEVARHILDRIEEWRDEAAASLLNKAEWIMPEIGEQKCVVEWFEIHKVFGGGVGPAKSSLEHILVLKVKEGRRLAGFWKEEIPVSPDTAKWLEENWPNIELERLNSFVNAKKGSEEKPSSDIVGETTE